MQLSESELAEARRSGMDGAPNWTGQRLPSPTKAPESPPAPGRDRHWRPSFNVPTTDSELSSKNTSKRDASEG